MSSTLAPVVRTVDVKADADKAFRVFTERIGEWWPLEVHSIHGDKTETCVIEPVAGGRVYEVARDGAEASWGEVLEYDPPNRVVIAWKPNTEPTPPTRLEVTFTPTGDGTRVQLTHTGWELLGDVAEEARHSYDEGWVPTLERYAGHIQPP